MKINDDTFDKIEKYIRGKLSEAEAATLEKEIAASPELQEAVDLARIEKDAGEYLLEEDLRAQIDQWEKNPLSPVKENGKSGSNPFTWWIGLLAVVVVVSLFFFLRNVKNEPASSPPVKEEIQETDIPIAEEETETPEETEAEVADKQVAGTDRKETSPAKKQPPTPAFDTDELIAYVETEAYDLPDYLKAQRSADTGSQENALNRGTQALLNENYADAVAELESIAPESDLYEAAKETLAHAYFKNRQFGKAATLFQSLANESSFNKDEPEWYLLLSLMADYKKNKEKADALLKKISGDELHNYQQAAVRLKEKKEAAKN